MQKLFDKFSDQGLNPKLEFLWTVSRVFNKVYLERNNSLMIMNVTEHDVGEIGCKVKVIPSRHPVANLSAAQSFVFNRIVLPALFPQFGATATLVHKRITCSDSFHKVS